jgi:hypothetical protein
MQITVPTQLYLCANQLHVSAIYSNRNAEQRTVNNKNVRQCNKFVGKKSRLTLLYSCMTLYKSTRKYGLVKGLWKIIRVIKFLIILSLKK